MDLANEVKKKYFKNTIELCSIIPAKLGKCSGDCKFCTQSVYNKTGIEIRGIDELKIEKVINQAKKMKDFNISRFTTHTYQDKIDTIKVAEDAGLEICCGGITSMGESIYDRIDMAFALKELNVDSIPINILNPIKGTPLGNQKLLDVDEILKSMALFRIIIKYKHIRFAGGSTNALEDKELDGYLGGISSAIFGDLLTTKGNQIQKDIKRLNELNLIIGRI